MVQNEPDRAAVRLPPPLVYLGGIVAGLLVHHFVWPLSAKLPSYARVTIAVVVAIASISLLGGALRLFRRTGQDPEPWKPTPEIITTGVYRYTRNPMYIGLALFQIALGVALANGWILVLAPVALGTVYLTAVQREEAYLERKFGAEYLDYKSSVRRWL